MGLHVGIPLVANWKATQSFKYQPFDPTVPSEVWESLEAEAERVKTTYMNGMLYPVDLNIRNPLRVRDHCDVVPSFMNWYPSSVSERSGVGDPRTMRAAEEREDYHRARQLFIEAAEDIGYDG